MPTTRTQKKPLPPESGEVLTLPEAAAFRRLSEDEVVHLVAAQSLPGRRIGEQWRFLKAAIRSWLSSPTTRATKEAQLAVVGTWKEDTHVADELREIYAQRGRPADGELP